MTEQLQQQPELFRGFFGRLGEVRPSFKTITPTMYEVATLNVQPLPQADETVRQVETDFAPIYDGVQFTTPGMRFMALFDTLTLKKWMGDITGKRILDIGPGTGRITLPMAEAVGQNGRVYAVETAQGYLDVLRQKAGKGGLNPNSLKLGLGDIQSINLAELEEFTGGGNLDAITLWFGPLALMTTSPEDVLKKAAALLRPGGQLMLTTNSLNGVAYRIPELFKRTNPNLDLPLGYQPSIFTKRSFPSDDSRAIPDGMILGNGSVLPARFYSPAQLSEMAKNAGLEVQDVVGISFLTGLFPEKPSPEAYKIFKETAQQLLVGLGYTETARQLANTPVEQNSLWQFAATFDATASRDQRVIDHATYPAIKAVKK